MRKVALNLNRSESQRWTHEYFVRRVFRESPTVKVIGRYVNQRTRVRCACTICKHRWFAHAGNLVQGRGCPVCALKEGNLRRVQNAAVRFKQKAEELQIEVLTPYRHALERVEVRCRKCGYEWSPLPSNLVRQGCRKCKSGRTSHNATGTPEHDAYLGARERCSSKGNNPANVKNYVNPGVTFVFESFPQFLKTVGPMPSYKKMPGHHKRLYSLGRYLDTGNYQSGNCEWQTHAQQEAEKHGKRAMLRFRKARQAGKITGRVR